MALPLRTFNAGVKLRRWLPRRVTDGFGFAPYANGVDCDPEDQRGPPLHRLVGEGELPAAYATEDSTVPLGEQHVRRVFGSFEQCDAYWRAFRTGELPAHIDRVVWRGWLSVSRKSMRWWPISIAVFVVIGVMQILNHDWGLAVLSAVLLIWYGICGPVQKGRISRLTVAVEQRTTAAAHAD